MGRRERLATAQPGMVHPGILYSGMSEKWGEKKKSTFPNPPNKHKTLAVSTRLGMWD